MRTAFRLWWLWLSLVSVVVGFIWFALPDGRTSEQRLRDQTSNLPSVSIAELYVLDESQKVSAGQGFPIRPYGHEVAVVSQKTLSGLAAEELAQIWRSREFSCGGALCHYPVYGLRFRSGRRVVLETSICWECTNFFVEANAGTYNWQGMCDLDRNTVNQRPSVMDYALLRKLRALLPPPPRVQAAIALEIGRSELGCQRYLEALRELDDAVRLDPHNFQVRTWRAIYFEKTEQPEAAIEEVSESLLHALDWQREDAFTRRAKLLLKQGKLNDALQDATSALREHSDGWSPSELYQLRAEIYDKLGRKDDAEKDRKAAAAH